MSLLGYSPYNAPYSGCPISPFDEVFDGYVNLMYVQSLENVDAILLWGGTDISPALYNEEKIPANYGPTIPSERDVFEWNLIKEAYRLKKPIIGVCRGAQMLCAFAGGKLVQDCTSHQGNHPIKTVDGKEFTVSSSHHQMMFPYEVEHLMLGWSEPRSSFYKGITQDDAKCIVREPEVVYFPEINGMGIQCHPEWHKKGDPFNTWIMEQILALQFK